MDMGSRWTWWNGELVPSEEAHVPFLTAALHYGFAAFEGIRCYETLDGPAVFRLPEHARRLCDSVRTMGLEMPWTAAQVARACIEVVAANGLRECYVRPLAFVSRGGFDLSLHGAGVSLGIAAWKWNAYLGDEARSRGVRANVSSFTRLHPNVMMTKAKVAGNYVNSALARTESMRAGFDEAIMLDPQGFVSECTGENIFLVRDGRIHTPGRSTILEGITRETLCTLARELGFEVVEQSISRDQLYVADEIFVCGTAAEVIGIREVDCRPIGDGTMGPVTRAVQSAYHAAVRGRDPRHREWLTAVPAPQPVREDAAQAGPV